MLQGFDGGVQLFPNHIIGLGEGLDMMSLMRLVKVDIDALGTEG